MLVIGPHHAAVRAGVNRLAIIFLFLSYSVYLIMRFAFFSISIISTTGKFCGKVPDQQFQFTKVKFCLQVFDEVYIFVAVSVAAVL